MSELGVSPDDLAFSASVRAAQARKGSRHVYEEAVWPTEISPDLRAFVAAQRSIFLASASADGRPYIQHRGGPPGFLKVLDSRTIAFADFRGNRQFITTGNVAENDRVELLLIDYTHARRVKIWGRARIVEDDVGLITSLMPEGYRARADQVVIVTVEAWDVNCPQHIPQRFEADDVRRSLIERDTKITELQTEIARLERLIGARDICGDDL
ncbi:MAG: pyridoxamine 5'-phosphate oxidase family protein [Rhizobiales bacterium]|nr:pyridoxamine 5'-phosphate oxidase family protein [Hyphomicrobiales bacterium]